MAVNDYIAQGMQPFNAASTLAFAENLRGAKSENALLALQLAQEQNPGSRVNRARDIELGIGQAELEAAQLRSAVPKLSAALDAMGTVKQTIANKGVAAGRQRLSEQLSFLQSQGLLPKDFDLGVDTSELSDEDFVREIDQAEQEISGALSSLVPQENRTSAAIGDMQALGYPMTQEGFKQYNEDRGTGTPEGLQALIAEANLRGILIEQETAAEDRRAQREQEQLELIRNLEQNRSAVDLTERLEGTLLGSGSVVPSNFRRGLADLQRIATGLQGQDTSELDQMIADFDTQRKMLQDQVNSRLRSGEYGRSAMQLGSIERSLASPDISPQAIIRIQGQLAQMDLDRAQAQDIEIPDRAEWERRAQEWKDYSVISPSSISKMNRNQIASLDIESLTDEQAEAALRRLDELQ